MRVDRSPLHAFTFAPPVRALPARAPAVFPRILRAFFTFAPLALIALIALIVAALVR